MRSGKLNIIVLLLVSLFFSTSSWEHSASLHAQKANDGVKTEQVKEQKQNKNKQAIENTAIREEIQRYIGYEPLFYRYLTLPYDLTVNSNVQGPFIEIGYLLLIFLPILLFIGFRKRKYLSVLTMLIVLCIGFISLSNNPLRSDGKTGTAEEIATFINGKSGTSTLLESIIGNIYIVIKKLPGINSLTANEDYFSYIAIIGLFTFLFFLIHERIKEKSLTSRIATLYLQFYAFLFLIMTAGIVWYGYLFFAIATIFLFKEIYEYRKSSSMVRKYVYYLCGASSIMWVMMAFTFRVTNHNKSSVNHKNASLMYETSMVSYQAGQNSKDDLKEIFFRNSAVAFDEINNDINSNIIKIGTPFNFFIEKSDSRVVEDNQLNKMSRLIKEMPDKMALAQALRDSGFKYLIVDLNTHTLDRTPEQTLVRKFENVLKFIFQNPHVEFMATDRLLKTPLLGDPSKVQVDYGVFGDIHYAGTYAIYRLK